MTTQKKEVSNITELKPNTWYKLIDKEGWLSSDLENPEIYEELFNTLYDTVFVHYVNEGYGSNVPNACCLTGEYDIITPSEIQYFTEVVDEKGATLETSKNNTETIPQQNKGIVSDSRESGSDSVTEAPDVPEKESTAKSIHYTKEMYDEGIIPEKGMLVLVDGKEIEVTEVRFKNNLSGNSVFVSIRHSSGCCPLDYISFPEPDLMEEELNELEAIICKEVPYNVSSEVLAKAVKEYYHNKYNLEVK